MQAQRHNRADALLLPRQALQRRRARCARGRTAAARSSSPTASSTSCTAATSTYLAQARALGASLVVGLNSDASARRLGKGPDRPLNAETDRACVLAALESVSLVTLFDEATPVELLKRLRPQLYVKGGDYDIETLEETRVVRSWGGDARALSFVDGYSTTALVKRIRL